MEQKISCHKGRCKDITDTLRNRIHSLNNFDEIELKQLKRELR